MDLYAIRNLLAQGKMIYDIPLKVTFYARVSTDSDDQLNSLENQVMYFKNFIKDQVNWTYVEGYIDEGISGTSVNKRDSFLKMIEDGKDLKFNLILTKEISRFSRKTIDSIKYTQELLSYGIGVYFLNDNINTFHTDSELRLTIMSSIAQEEIRKLSERIRFGYKRSVEKGIMPGANNIYGYIKDVNNKGKYLIDEEQASIVRKIFEMYANDNIGMHKIGHILYNDYGIKSSTGNPLAGPVIRNILENPKYKGYFCANKETTVDYNNKKRVKIPKDKWIVYKDNKSSPPIVSEELWEKANKTLEKRTKINSENRKVLNFNRYPLSGKLICQYDNATYNRGYWTNKRTNTKRFFWGCGNYRKYGRQKVNGCNSQVIYLEEMQTICKNIISNIIDNENAILNELFELIKVEKTNKTKNDVDIMQVNKKLDKLKREKDELIKMRMNKEIDSVDFNHYKEDIENNLLKANNELNEIENREEKMDSLNIDLITFIKEIKSSVLSEENVLSVAHELFDKIYVETIQDGADRKTILHIKLNMKSQEKCDYSLENFSLLFRNDNRCCRSTC